MRDLVLFAHVIMGLAVIVMSVIILINSKKKSKFVRHISLAVAVVSWIEIIPSAILYLLFYPATKTLIKAGAWPWAHSVIMETKEHWGLLVPVIATVAAWLVLTGKIKDSRKWWMLLIALVTLIGIFGRLVKVGALAQ